MNNSAFAFLAILVPLVVFHEFGHFIVCKLGGIRVTKFAFGFGKKLFGFTYRGTEYRWNLIPLGGYVDFMGEVMYTDEIPSDVKHFYNKPKWLRFLVLVMGPVFNLILAFGIYWAFFASQPVPVPKNAGPAYTVGFVLPGSAEDLAGLRTDDRITVLDGKEVTAYDQVEKFFLLNPGKEISMVVQRGETTTTLNLEVPRDKIQGTGKYHFEPKRVIKITELQEGMPAEKAGLKEGDQILRVNDRIFSTILFPEHSLSKQLQEVGPESSRFVVNRDGQEIALDITPVLTDLEDPRAQEYYGSKQVWRTGLMHTDLDFVELSVKQGFHAAWDRLLDDSVLLLQAVRQLVKGRLSVRSLSGPVEIGRIAKKSIDRGLWFFLVMMAILSVNLGILNLLPIPVLDGGEIFVLLVEWITRRDFSIPAKMRIKLVGFFFLVGLMGIVIVTDIIKATQTMG